MWKYACKQHLLYLLIAMAAGAILIGGFQVGQEAILSSVEMVQETMGNVPEEYFAFIQEPAFMYIFGAAYIGGFVNGLLLMFALNRRFNLHYMIFMLIFLLGSEFVVLGGMFLLLPAIVVCIYGMLTLPNRKERENLKRSQTTTIQELKRVYELHHKINPDCEKIGQEAAMNLIKIAVLNALAIGIYILVVINVYEIMILMIAGAILMVALFLINQMRSKAAAPVAALLYERCDPEGCASAIFAMAAKLHRRKRIPLLIQLAECMIYLNDPHLCIDVMAMQTSHRGVYVYTYHALMAEAYYLLGDKLMVESHSELLQQEMQRSAAGQSVYAVQAVESIQSRIDLLEQKFSNVRAYYEKYSGILTTKAQLVDFNYYLGLLDFVERDFRNAASRFAFVKLHGSKTYFGTKANEFMELIDRLDTEA